MLISPISPTRRPLLSSAGSAGGWRICDIVQIVAFEIVHGPWGVFDGMFNDGSAGTNAGGRGNADGASMPRMSELPVLHRAAALFRRPSRLRRALFVGGRSLRALLAELRSFIAALGARDTEVCVVIQFLHAFTIHLSIAALSARNSTAHEMAIY